MKTTHELIDMKTLDLWAVAWTQAPVTSPLPHSVVRALERILFELKAVLWSGE